MIRGDRRGVGRGVRVCDEGMKVVRGGGEGERGGPRRGGERGCRYPNLPFCKFRQDIQFRD